jgi:short-subunit dehydrogenase
MQKGFYIITGAGSGIGQALARAVAQAGNPVIITDLNQTGLQQTEADIQKMGAWVKSYLFDVAQAEAIEKFAQEILEIYAPENIILINNAGVALGSGNFVETDLKDFEWLININLWGVIRMSKAFLPYMLQKNQGHIVNVSSVFGLGGFIRQSAYCTAKFGVKGFTDALKMELIGTRVKASSVHPGGIKTNIARNSRTNTNLSKEQIEIEIANFEKTFKKTPEFAASTILKGIAKGKSRILIGRDARIIDFFTRFFPDSYHKILLKFIPKPVINLKD